MILPAIATGMGALVFAGFHSMLPKSQLYGRTFIGDSGRSKRLALTFDDGPNDPHTLDLLDVLGKLNVKATFFMIGKFVRQRPDIARAVVAAGHEIGNHTHTHPNLIFRTSGEVRREIAACEAAIQEAAGSTTRLFRPPWGGRRPGTLRAVRSAGYEPILWSASSYDWKARSAAEIVANLSRQVRGGEVILLHDGSHTCMGADRSLTVQATGDLVRHFRDEGYGFATVSEMMKAVNGSRH